MQLMLILGIVFAIGAVVFALQNNVAIIVTFAVWQFEGSQALVLLLTLGVGALIAGLVSSPTVIRRQWEVTRMRRQIVDLERKVGELQSSEANLVARVQELSPAASAGSSGGPKADGGLGGLVGGGGSATGGRLSGP